MDVVEVEVEVEEEEVEVGMREKWTQNDVEVAVPGGRRPCRSPPSWRPRSGEIGHARRWQGPISTRSAGGVVRRVVQQVVRAWSCQGGTRHGRQIRS